MHDIPAIASAPSPLELSGVRVALGGRTILEAIDLTLRPGERVALLGPNGAGKTTLLRAALGLVPLAAGWSRLHGHDAASTTGRIAGLARTGATLEQPGLPQQAIARDYLGWWARLHGVASPDERADHLLAEWGIPPDSRAERLSQGQRQILQILRCLVHDPALLVLDEPTSFLDPDSRARFEDGIRRWREGTRGALLLSTHHIDDAASLVDRLVVLSEGRLRRQGPPDELLGSYEFTRLLRLDPGTADDRIRESLAAASPAVSATPAGTVRGCPAWRVACGTGEHGHGALLASLARDGIQVRSLDRDEATLREFWDASLRSPAASSPPRAAPAIAPGAAPVSPPWEAAWTTARFQLRLVARERRLLWPIALLEAFFLGSMALAVGPGIAGSDAATVVLLAGLLPVGLAASLAADTFAGERERRSLETLLCAPLPALPLFAGKGLAAFLPGQILSWIGAALGWILLAHARAAPPAGQALVLVLAVLPAMGMLATATALTASRRSRTVRGAAQISAMGLLPLLAGAQILPRLVAHLAPAHAVAAWIAIAIASAGLAVALAMRSAARLVPARLLRD